MAEQNVRTCTITHTYSIPAEYGAQREILLKVTPEKVAEIALAVTSLPVFDIAEAIVKKFPDDVKYLCQYRNGEKGDGLDNSPAEWFFTHRHVVKNRYWMGRVSRGRFGESETSTYTSTGKIVRERNEHNVGIGDILHREYYDAGKPRLETIFKGVVQGQKQSDSLCIDPEGQISSARRYLGRSPEHVYSQDEIAQMNAARAAQASRLLKYPKP